MKCRYCRSENAADAFVCEICGKRLISYSENGKQNEDDPEEIVYNRTGLTMEAVGIVLPNIVGVVVSIVVLALIMRGYDRQYSDYGYVSTTKSDTNKKSASEKKEYNSQTNTSRESVTQTKNTTTAEHTTEEDTREEGQKIKDKIALGKAVSFGSYGGKDIEWIVLDCDDEKALLWSVYCLDAKPYNDEDYYEEVFSWETCSLRRWLNLDFLETAFDKTERMHIVRTELENNDCGNTRDWVFILSAKDLAKYDCEEWRTGHATGYAANQGVYVTSTGRSQYWIRGNEWKMPDSDAELIDYDEEIDSTTVEDDTVGVRPAVWIQFESSEKDSVDDNYILKDSPDRYITKEDIKDLSQEELLLAKSEIYARHGCAFHDSTLTDYFSEKTWYHPVMQADWYADCLLNPYEKYNVEFLAAAADGGEYAGASTVYHYDELEEIVLDEFSGEICLDGFEHLWGTYDTYEGDSMVISGESFNGHPYRVLMFNQNDWDGRYRIVLEVYQEDGIRLCWIDTEGDSLNSGFIVSFYDKDGNMIMDDGYEDDGYDEDIDEYEEYGISYWRR